MAKESARERAKSQGNDKDDGDKKDERKDEVAEKIGSWMDDDNGIAIDEEIDHMADNFSQKLSASLDTTLPEEKDDGLEMDIDKARSDLVKGRAEIEFERKMHERVSSLHEIIRMIEA